MGGPRINRFIPAISFRIFLPLIAAGLLVGWNLLPSVREAEAAERPHPGPRVHPSAKIPVPAAIPTLKKSPSVRIGLTTSPLEIRLFGSGGVRIVDPAEGKPVWKPKYSQPVVVTLDLPQGAKPRTVFRVQVGSFSDSAEADDLKGRLEKVLADPVIVAFSPDRNVYRVRVGQFESREDAASLTEQLLDQGFGELWVSEEPGPSSGRARLRIVDSRYYSKVLAPRKLLVLPDRAAGQVEVDGKLYRGTVELRIVGDRIIVINELDLEDYLRGVVPNELGPEVFPELEALKAQAVAARTYIVANFGQFAEFGYDICDSPSCQVYKGFSTEHEMTDRAIEETRGIVASFQGKPIKALYTSTCGGHTEDGVNVFRDLKLDYLKGVECYPESPAPVVLVGAKDLPAVNLPTGGVLSSEAGLLVVMGVVSPEILKPDVLMKEPTPEEVVTWLQKAFRLIGAGSMPPGFKFESGSRLEWSRFLIRAFKWQDRAKLALDERDLPYLLGAEAEKIPEVDRIGIGFLISQGILHAYLDGGLELSRPATRANLLAWIYRIAEEYGALSLVDGGFRSLQGETLHVYEKGQVVERPLASKRFIYRRVGQETYPAEELALAAGDPLRYHLNSDGRVDAVILEPSTRGASDDRFSNYYQWQVRYTRKELEQKIRKRVNIGRLRDVIPTKWGVSGRVIQVKVKGSRGTFTLNGFKIRTALGLRENLFTIERQVDPGGGVRAFTLAGKGWGHGVGLCQVGAYGMAIRGETYDRILNHYYTGIDLVPLYR